MWKDAKKELPPLYEDVLAYDGVIYAVANYYGETSGGWASFAPIEDVKFWMWLPPVPDVPC